MDLKLFFISFFSILLSMVVLDALWLGLMMKRFYQPQLAHLISETPKILPAAIFYLIFAFSLALFVVLPAVQHQSSIGSFLMMGMLFGLATYATYDLTNQATMRSWPTVVTLVDLAWGVLLTGVVSLIAVNLTKRFL